MSLTLAQVLPVMAAINTAGLVDAPYPVQDTLFFKIQGSPESIRDTSNVVQEIVQRHGSTRFEFAATEEEAGEMWENRKYVRQPRLFCHNIVTIVKS